MTSTGDKEARSLPFVVAEDGERKGFAVGAFGDNKIARAQARRVEIKRQVWCLAHCSASIGIKFMIQ